MSSRRQPHYRAGSTRCGCGKILHHSLEDAKAGRRYYALTLGEPDQLHREEVRYYECEYGGWHWTRRVSEAANGAGR